MKEKPGTKKIETKKLAVQSVHKPATIQSKEARKPKKANIKPIQTKSDSFRSRSLRFVFALYLIKKLFLMGTWFLSLLSKSPVRAYREKERTEKTSRSQLKHVSRYAAFNPKVDEDSNSCTENKTTVVVI